MCAIRIKSEDKIMNMSKQPFKIILLLMSLALPFTVSADAASDTSAAIAADPINAAAIVATAIAANPGQAAAITAAAIIAAPTQAAAITTAAVRAAPTQAAAITTAAVRAAPTQAAAITRAAVAAAPTQESAIVAAAIAAAPEAVSAIIMALDVYHGAPIPGFNLSESTTNNTAMQVDVIVSAINACGNNNQCVQSIINQVISQVSNPAELAAILKEVKVLASPN
jgi:hypothetical protein